MEMAGIEYDDQETGNAEIFLCKKYMGLIPPMGLYFTEGDRVVVESELGRTYDSEGVVVEISSWVKKSYLSQRKGKHMEGPFGIFTVQITAGENKGHILHHVKSEDMVRRVGDSRGGGSSSNQEKKAVDIGTVRSTREVIPVAPVVGGGGGSRRGGSGRNNPESVDPITGRRMHDF